VNVRFYRYVLSAFEDSLKALGQGSTFSELSTDSLASFEVPFPPTKHQRAIAMYLYAETARIDALIEKKREMAEMLNLRVISLSSDLIASRAGEVPTGIPSIPSIPSNWTVRRNKTFMREVSEPSKTGTEEMLSVSHLTGVTPRSEKTVYMFEAESTVGYKRVEPGDLVINTMWAWMGAAGVSKVPGIVSPAYGVYRFDRNVAIPAFIDALVRTPAYIAEMARFSRGVTSSRLRLYPGEFLSLSIPLPSLDEQEELVSRIARAGKASAKTSLLIEAQVTLLREYRRDLITSAVTGELEVPGVAA
jgi:type I restriction enzyme S subunit